MEFWLIGLAVFGSHFVEGVSGFGCMVLALPVLSFMMEMKEAVPLLVILSTLFDLALVWQDRRHIKWLVVLKVVTITSICMPAGFWVLQHCSERVLKILLGLFMILLAINGIYGLQKRTQVKKSESKQWNILALPLAGLVQGAFGGSGPFIIVYTRNVLHDKTTFRGTMAVIWVLLNAVNLIQFKVSGMLTISVYQRVITMLPFVIAGFLAGTAAHKKINDRQFQQAIYGIMCIAGLIMVV